MTSTSSPRWNSQSFKQAPHLAFLSLAASITLSALALFIVQHADDTPVDSWRVSPAIFLSIFTTLSGIVLRSAFQTGAESYWWSLLLSDPGASIQTMHVVWGLGRNPWTLFNIKRSSLEPVLRTAGVFMILIAAIGPLLQSAVTVELRTIPSSYPAVLPIRRQAMWNMTVRPGAHYYTSPIYQNDFAQVVADLNQRAPITLPTTMCPENSKCTTTVTIASFSRDCTKEYAPAEGAQSVDQARMVALGGQYMRDCPRTGWDYNGTTPEGESVDCAYMELRYQLGLRRLSRNTLARNGSFDTPNPDELPWLRPDLPPGGLNYTSWFREDVNNNRLTVQRCNFSTAFVEIPIEITGGREVRMKNLEGDESALASRNRGVESIPSGFVDHGLESRHGLLTGIQQAMTDLYTGYVFYDFIGINTHLGGIGSRQFINQSSIVQQQRLEFTFLDPLDTFTEALHEISLRYALRRLSPTTMDEHPQQGENEVSRHRRRALELMPTKPALDQTVTIQETRIIAIYRTNLAFALVAVCISCLTTLLVALLFAGWKRLGRKFSMAPLEIAKAFDAPLLRDAENNATGDKIAEDLGGIRVRYGEKEQQQGLSRTETRNNKPSKSNTGVEESKEVDAGVSQPTESETEANTANGTRLVIDQADQVTTPVKGRIYS